MAALTDEILMAYADGALDPAASAQVEALLEADPEARAQVAMFRATGRALGVPFEGILHEPVPVWLSQFVMSYGAERPDGPAQANAAPAMPLRRTRPAGLWATWRERLLPAGAGWQLAAASAAALMLGTGAGFLLRGGDEAGGFGANLAVLRDGQLQAGGLLHQVLETVPSSEERGAGSTQGSMAVRAVLTFQTKAGGYCREYEIVTAAQGQFQGLACREAGGQWAVQVHAAQAVQTVQTRGLRAAGHSEVLDRLTDLRMEGDALGESQEKAVIKNGWK